MDIDVRPIHPDELRATFVTVETAFGGHLEEAFLAFHRPFIDPERTHAAFDGDAIVGSAGVSPFTMTVPGGEIRAAGVTGVGVMPSHRRRGVNTALMRAQLDDIHARGEPVAVLFASQGSIYGRYGYGIASLNAGIDVETSRSAFGPWYTPSGRVRLFERDDAIAAFLPVYEEVRRSRPGMMRLDEREFAYRLDDRLMEDDKPVPGFFAGHESDGRVDAYVQYRVKHGWDVVPKNELVVEDLVGVTPQAYADMWRYVLDVDLVHRVRAWNRPPDDPILHLVLEPRPLHFQLKDAVWLRLVDVEAALAARGYRTQTSVILDVRDAFCPWNEARYELRTGDGGAACRRTDDEPDLVLGVVELGAAFLGGTRLSTLHRAGRVEERTPGAVDRADAAFAWDPAPWCSFMF
ncbi:MAG: GNAT family N-acetyltransferase [Actinomycetota bacterium]